jgi:hypothetical protein
MTFKSHDLWFAAALWALANVAAATPRVWSFSAFLDERPIGHQRFTLTGQGDALDVAIETRFAARFYGLFAYHYAHDATESWQGGCLARMAARTDDDGRLSQVSVVPGDGGLRVRGPGGAGSLEGCVMSYAYWNPLILQQQRLLNAQTGEMEPIVVAALGVEPLNLHGNRVSARHFRITRSGNPLDLWYSESGDWLALESSLGGGRRLRYQRD